MVQNFDGIAKIVFKEELGNAMQLENIGKEFLIYQLQVGEY